MSNEHIGRNDPCPCGSGKKYKRCCLAADEQRARTRALPVPATAAPDPDPDPDPDLPRAFDPRRLAATLHELARRGPADAQREFTRLLSEAEPVLAYMDRQPEIEAASRALEAHRASFDQLVQDTLAYQERTEALFAEERFAPLRFTAEDVRRAFDHVGYPPTMAPDDDFVRVLRAAILHLADKPRRCDLAMRLLFHLPDFVADGRPLDAWIIQHCAYRTADETEESNPFLFAMFCHGYDAWVAEQRARDETTLRELGLDLPRLQSMSLDEIDALVNQLQTDPAKHARLEAILKTQPDQRALAVANFEAMERSAVKLLDRDDAAGLLLSAEELTPWVPRVIACMETMRPHLPDPTDTAPPDPAVGEMLTQTLQPLLSDMAGTIFTPARRQQLAEQLRTYRNSLFAAGDKRAAGSARAAMNAVERADKPAENYFLVALCFASLRRASDPTDDHAPA
jgi:hypothetical protein